MGKVFTHFSKPERKFVEECIYGIQASGDTKLSSIVRAIDDNIRPIYTEKRLSRNLSLAPVVEVPYKRGLALLIFTILAIASHHQLETLLGLGRNSVLLIAPLVCAGLVMILRPERARHYVEREVDWWTLLFFMLLFAIAGTLEHTHVDRVMADYFTQVCGGSPAILIPFILVTSAIGSAFVDNVIFVAAFCPVIEQLSVSVKAFPLWWALLFGACIGGNITMIGSTANIVALGMLEKKAPHQMGFFAWLKVGAVSALLACGVVWIGLTLTSPLMPDRPSKVGFDQLEKRFENKLVEIDAICAAINRVDGREEIRLTPPDGESEPVIVAIPEVPVAKMELAPGKRAIFRGLLTGDGTQGEAPTLRLQAATPVGKSK